MAHYKQIIFLCNSNTFLSPIAEAIYRRNAADWMPEAISRGAVVLFEEPINPKCNLLLSQNGFLISSHGQAKQLAQKDLEKKTLVLTMTLSEKVKICEEFHLEEDVYTLGEYVGEDTDIADPAGGEEEKYKECFEQIKFRINKVIDRIRREYWDM